MRAIAMSAALMAAPAAAQEVEALTCIFEQECLTGEACAATTFEITVVERRGAAPDPDAEDAEAETETLLRTIAGDIDVVSAAETGEGRAWLGLDGLDSHALSVASDRSAVYTAQIPAAEMALTYLGDCEGLG
ncbi:hypothetical protein jaqu_09890 [Jannaschia aquimarina]|uniref:Uncharacterized protein n=2 Tax=Jannaschia aquimarina TaxID=935700 RepID=A0A0D1DBD0_9RHOB|nr:hypothetical protein jaqu_09890 [Jannaschia aquimarina]SNT19202.1 hypothetical protein SAMN05421775_107115 [Jannaschia aquimarina]